jgi:D-alanine--poly(phosphoribitol) ligase subunit 2
MDELMALLKEIRPDVAFEADKRLVDDGVLDSFDVVAIVGEIGERFSVEVPVEEIRSDNFNSPEAMLRMIERLKADA